jgi:hypothetical protein
VKTRLVLLGGVVAGIAGGIAVAVTLTVMFLINGVDVLAAAKSAALPVLGARALRPGSDLPALLVGVAAHFAISIAWGVAFALLVFGISRPTTVLAGAAWGVFVWLVMDFVVLPVGGWGQLARGPTGPAVFHHVIYGLGVGVAFLPYQRPAARPRPWWRGPLRARA